MGFAELNTDVPHPARVYDYLLGGKDNFQADRDAVELMMRTSPNVVTTVRANRDFMARVARYLAAERGIDQFLDIGTGLPTSPNLHEVVQSVAPECRVVYVDNDPIVLVHARALLTSTPQGRTAYVDADLRDPEAILTAPQLTATLDLDRPVALCLLSILHFLADEDELHRIIDRLVRPLAPGSILAVSTLTADGAPEEFDRMTTVSRASGIPVRPRNRAEVEALFAGLKMVDPGVVPVHRWHPDDAARAVRDSQALMYGGLAVKP